MRKFAFTTEDIVQVIIEAEEAGVEYCGCLTRNAQKQGVREAFDRLTQQEERHVRELQSLRNRLAGPRPARKHKEERAAYLRDLARSRVQVDASECRTKAEATATVIDAAGLALQFEKDVLLLLHELRHLMKGPQEKAVESLLWEESRHFRRLRDVTEGEEW